MQEAIGEAAGALADEAIVERMVARLGEPRVPPAERAHLVHAVGALGAVSAGLVVDAYLHAPAELREAYRAAMREAGERAAEILQSRIESKVPEVVAAAAEFLGLTAGPQPRRSDRPHAHTDDACARAALLCLAELGPASVRPACPRSRHRCCAGRRGARDRRRGDVGATTVLVRPWSRSDEGVLAALRKRSATRRKKPCGSSRLPAGWPARRRRSCAPPRSGCLALLDRSEAKALLELYSRDKEPTVKRQQRRPCGDTRAAKTSDAALAQTITREVAKRVVGQEVMVERLLIGLLTGGHILLEGVPGLAKTLAVKTVAECLRISFSRIQFTPDLLPADVIGTMGFDTLAEFYPKRDRCSRPCARCDSTSPPKVRCLRSRGGGDETGLHGGETFFLGEPFLVLATQTPSSTKGTYPLPGHLDRFMLKVRVAIPRAMREGIVGRMASGRPSRSSASPYRRHPRGGRAIPSCRIRVVDYIVDACGHREPMRSGFRIKP